MAAPPRVSMAAATLDAAMNVRRSIILPPVS
jgi:hypothetical protein